MEQTEQTVKLELSLAQTNLLLKALSKLPLEEVLTTFVTIKQSAEEQLKPEVKVEEEKN